jgi:hypothetical protein
MSVFCLSVFLRFRRKMSGRIVADEFMEVIALFTHALQQRLIQQ